MTAVAEAPSAPEWPEGALYYSPRGIYDFQAEGVAHGLIQTDLADGSAGVLIVWDTGLGKSHFGMILSTMLFEMGLIDSVMVICERVKMGEWVDDYREFTRLSVRKHHGTGREKRFAKHGKPQVLVGTFETVGGDLAKVTKPPGKRGKTLVANWLLEHYRGERVLVIFDEATKLKNRDTDLVKRWRFVQKVLRKEGGMRAAALTATPYETGLDDIYNLRLVVKPDGLPLIKDYEARYVRGRDPFGRPTYWPHLLPEFYNLYVKGFIHRKRKTDPDVRDQFPAMTEDGHPLEMAPDQAKFYEAVADLAYDDEGDYQEVPGLYTVLRQVAAYPEALIYSQGALAQMLVEEFGADYLRGLSSVKAEWVLDHASKVMAQGDKLIVFSFFGRSVVPLVARDLERKKHKVFINHGGLSEREADDARRGFRQWDGPAVLVTSDAGSKGLNYPEASYLTNYELPTLHSTYTQRINRISRLVGGGATATVDSLIVQGTVEVARAAQMIDRNEDSDVVLGDSEYQDDHFVSAADRRAALGIHRRK